MWKCPPWCNLHVEKWASPALLLPKRLYNMCKLLADYNLYLAISDYLSFLCYHSFIRSLLLYLHNRLWIFNMRTYSFSYIILLVIRLHMLFGRSLYNEVLFYYSVMGPEPPAVSPNHNSRSYKIYHCVDKPNAMISAKLFVYCAVYALCLNVLLCLIAVFS